MAKDIFDRFRQYLIGILSVGLVSLICYFLPAYMGYQFVALVLLFTVSVIAMFFDIFPVLTSAILGAVVWDFFFIPPKFTLYVSKPEDFLLLVMFLTIALVNTVLTYKKRQWESIARKREEKRVTLNLYNTLLNSLSHELRTPIATIIAAADNLKTDKAILSERDKDALVTEISKASLRLNGNVENLLNMSRLESGVIKPVKDWCDIRELINDVRSQLKEYSTDHSIQTEIKENMPLVFLDFGLISQCLYNLIYNALVYTPGGSTIHVSAMLNHKRLMVTIEDNGEGFPEEEIDNVFEKFYRLKKSGVGGTGLGLSIVKGFIEAHRGTISLSNVKNSGAKFTIMIPVETSEVTNLEND